MIHRGENKDHLTGAGWPSSQRASWLAPLAILFLALVLRLMAIAATGPPRSITGYSESGIVAENVVEGRGYTYDFYGLRPSQPLRAFVPPLFVGLIVLCLRFAAQPPLALALLHAVLASLAGVAIYLTALWLSGRRSVALLAGLGTACYPVFILMPTIPASLVLYMTALAWAVAMTVALARQRSRSPTSSAGWAWAVAAGVLWGMLALGRPAILGFLPLVALWLWWNRNSTGQWAQDSALLGAAAILVVVPWMIRNAQVLGRFPVLDTHGGMTFWNGNNPFTTGSGHDVYSEKVDLFLGQQHDPRKPAIVTLQPYPLPADIQAQVATIDEIKLDYRLYHAGLSYIVQHPGDWIALVAGKLRAFWWFRPNLGAAYEETWTRYYRPIYVLLLLLSTAGLVISARQWRRYSLLCLLFVYYAAIPVAFEVLTRYRWEIELFFLIFASLALVAAFEVYRSSEQARRLTTEVIGDPTAIRQ
jgi:hypothetical protein